MSDVIKCPRCSKADPSVLLDQDGDPYLCDSCWNDDDDTCQKCLGFIDGGNPFSKYCDTCLERTEE